MHLKLVDDVCPFNGGGLVWFLGDSGPTVSSTTEDAVSSKVTGLFPVPLAIAAESKPASTGMSRQPVRISFVEEHPIFRILSGQDNPFIDAVRVESLLSNRRGRRRYPGGSKRSEMLAELGEVKVLARLRTRENRWFSSISHGEGKVVTFLTSAGPLPTPDGDVWNNWASGPGAPSLCRHSPGAAEVHIARRDRAQPSVGRWESRSSELTPPQRFSGGPRNHHAG